MAETTKRVPNLLKHYREKVREELKSEFHYKNAMCVPRLVKIVVNMGIKEGKDDVKLLESLVNDLGMITGQKPLVTKAKKSVSGFKLREGQPVGAKVTLRGTRMYEFAERLFHVAMPRIRDFRGFTDKSFDQRGNYTCGLQEQIIFPEINFDKVRKSQGMDITFVTTAETAKEGKSLLEKLGFPFVKRSAEATAA